MTPLFTLLLGGCTLLGLGGANTMKALDDAPFSLGKVASALWAEHSWSEPDQGTGDAILLLSSSELSCQRLLSELDGEVSPDDSVLWTSQGIAVEFRWWAESDSDIGFEGSYQSGLGSGSYDLYGDEAASRTFQLTAFAEGTRWKDDDDFGTAELTALAEGRTTGTVQTTWVQARFDAEDCGQHQAGSEEHDDWYDADTGWYD